MSELSAEIMEALWNKEYSPWHLLGEPSPYFRYYHPYKNWDSYGEEPKRFVWSKLSCEYSWEECL